MDGWTDNTELYRAWHAKATGTQTTKPNIAKQQGMVMMVSHKIIACPAHTQSSTQSHCQF